MFKCKILLVLQHQKNNLLLADLLGNNYLVCEGNNELDFQQNFDLCIIDGASLARFLPILKQKKQAEKPLFLPVILISQRNDITLSTRNLWQIVEDIIFTPIRKQVLLAKIEVLLQTRRLSLQLRLSKNQSLPLDKIQEDQLINLMELSTDLETALNQRKLIVYYQPIIHLLTRKLIGFEALARWIHPNLGFIPPDQFIPLAIDISRIIELDLYMLEQASQQMNLWQSQLNNLPNLTISVNISSQCFSKPDLPLIVGDILQKTGFNPCQVKIEITERNILTESAQTLKSLEQLKELGCELWLDDFGTGYSSMSYLHFLPLDGLKIDKSFVQSFAENSKNQKIIQSIFALAEDFGIQIIAEGIETKTQLEQLQLSGCQYGQGYLFAKPLSAIQAEEYILSNLAAHRKVIGNR
jgi:EAL domain-containing protein (putative c-di-GMP-specific phosphodiesterase class I)